MSVGRGWGGRGRGSQLRRLQCLHRACAVGSWVGEWMCGGDGGRDCCALGPALAGSGGACGRVHWLGERVGVQWCVCVCVCLTRWRCAVSLRGHCRARRVLGRGWARALFVRWGWDGGRRWSVGCVAGDVGAWGLGGGRTVVVGGGGGRVGGRMSRSWQQTVRCASFVVVVVVVVARGVGCGAVVARQRGVDAAARWDGDARARAPTDCVLVCLCMLCWLVRAPWFLSVATCGLCLPSASSSSSSSSSSSAPSWSWCPWARPCGRLGVWCGPGGDCSGSVCALGACRGAGACVRACVVARVRAVHACVRACMHAWVDLGLGGEAVVGGVGWPRGGLARV